MKRLHKPIILCGFMAAGKTTIGKLLALKMDAPFLDTDEMLVKHVGLNIPDIFEQYGESYFRDKEYEITKQILDINAVISAGGGLLTFERNAKILKDKAIIICITRDFDFTYNILANDTTRPVVYNKSRQEIRNLYDSRMNIYSKYADFIIDNNSSPEQCVNKIIELLSNSI